MPNTTPDQRKLAAIMFTDMVGYSALSQENEAVALELLEEHRRLLRPIFAKHRGTEIKTIGDAFLIEFHSPVEAVRSAIAVQLALHERNQASPPERQLRIRIGIHLGDVVHRDSDVYGDGVNIASRIEPLAEPGGICITQQVYDHVHNKITGPLVKLGIGELKNIAVPVNLYRVVMPGENRRFHWYDQAIFQFRQKRTRAVAIGFILITLLAVAAWNLYRETRPPISPTASKAPSRSLARKETAGPKWIVVFSPPMVGGSVTQAAFSAGMARVLSSELGTISTLRVKSASAALKYAGAAKSMTEIAKELGVDDVLELSVQEDGTQAIIVANLNDRAEDRITWSTNFICSLSEGVRLQKDLARTVVSAVKATLTQGDEARLAGASPINPQAYREFVLAQSDEFATESETETEDTVARLERAINLDPQFALAYAKLAYALASWAYWLRPADPVLRRRAQEAVTRALTLNTNLADAYLARGQLAWIPANGFLHDEALSDFRRGLAINPSHDRAHNWLAAIYLHLGLHEEAEREYQIAEQINPPDLGHRFDRGNNLRSLHRYSEALNIMTNAQSSLPESLRESFIASALLGSKQTNEAAARIERFFASNKPDRGGNMTSMRAIVLAAAGDTNRALESIQKALQVDQQFGHFHHTAYNVASAYALLNQTGLAMEYLERASNEGYPCYSEFKTDPNFENVRSTPRYRDLMDKLKPDWERRKREANAQSKL